LADDDPNEIDESDLHIERESSFSFWQSTILWHRKTLILFAASHGRAGIDIWMNV
jgi:hypothetical protein